MSNDIRRLRLIDTDCVLHESTLKRSLQWAPIHTNTHLYTCIYKEYKEYKEKSSPVTPPARPNIANASRFYVNLDFIGSIKSSISGEIQYGEDP